MPLVVPTGGMIPLKPFAQTGTSLPVLGLGCMSMSDAYGKPTSEEESLQLIGTALDMGVVHFDTADMYGAGHNERLLGKAIKKYGRDKFWVSTKFGFLRDEETKAMLGFDASPEYVKKACDKSLERLGIEQIDLYYAHRIDPKTPVEETVKAMADLVKQGKVRYLGLSECSAETRRRAHKIHPITAVQTEFSLFHTDVLHNGVLEACKELGVAFVAYSPLGRGMVNGTIKKAEDIPDDDFRKYLPRFQGENFKKNMELVEAIKGLATEKGCTPGQLALAWTMKQSDIVFPIPGTKHIDYLVENLGSALVNLTDEDEGKLQKILAELPVAGPRYGENLGGRLAEDGSKM